MTLNREYVPKIGASVMMRSWSDYAGRQINMWARMRVHSINSDGATVQVLNGSEPTGQVLNIPLAAIAPPLGWRARYTIYVTPDEVEQVLGWFARGIVVRQSHALGGPMSTAFQPMDNSERPHWQYPAVETLVQARDGSWPIRNWTGATVWASETQSAAESFDYAASIMFTRAERLAFDRAFDAVRRAS